MKFLRKKLKNGITVIMEKRDLPVISVSISNPFGGANETSEIKGIAHFIEHLVFTGTKTRTHEDISREIEKKGGILNAFTANEVTSFWFKLPSEHIFAGLDILVDMLKNPLFKPDKFEKEKKVIMEEIKMYHDNPRYFIEEKIFGNLYEKPLGEGIIGSTKTISNLSRDFVYDYFKKHYSPENFIVTLVGNADFEKVCEYFEKNFKAENKFIPKISPLTLNKESEETRLGVDQAHFMFAMHAPLPQEKSKYALEVLDAYLANGMSSKLFLTIREERGLAYSVKSSINSEKNYAYYTIYVGTTKEAVPEVKKLILQGFSDIEKMTEEELEESKERLIGLKKVSSEESSDVMNALMHSEITGKAEEYYEYEDKIKTITLKDVKALAKITNYSTASIVPE